MEESQAIAAIRAGSLEGLATLVTLYQERAVQTAYLIVRDRASAEDIVQSAFIRAAEKIHKFDPSRSFEPWFLRIVVNAAVKAVQRQKRLEPLEDEQDSQVDTLAVVLADDRPLPEELAERADTHRLVWQALDRLQPEQRAAIVMRHYLEMSEAEMVEQLQRPRSTIKWWLHAARQRLRQLLSPRLKSRTLADIPAVELETERKETRSE